jgi:hypothetical protein
MTSIFLLSSLFFFLSFIVILIIIIGWKKLSLIYSFKSNPKLFINNLFDQLDLFRSKLPMLDLEEFTLLSNNSIDNRNAPKLKNCTTGYINNIYQENVILFLTTTVGFGKKMFIFATSSDQYAFVENSANEFQIFNKSAQIIANFKENNLLNTNGNVILGNINFDVNNTNRSIEIDNLETAIFNANSNQNSKVPTRHFVFVNQIPDDRIEYFTLLCFATLLDSIT